MVTALSATLQKICGANISTSGTTEVKVGGENGQGKSEEKVHVDAWEQSLGQSSLDGHEHPQHKSVNSFCENQSQHATPSFSASSSKADTLS